MDRGTSSDNDYCDGDDDNDDDEYNYGEDNIDGFAHNDFDDDDGDGVLQKRNLDNNKAASLHVSKANGRVRIYPLISAVVVKPTGVSVNAILSIFCQMKHNHPHRHCD